LKRKGKSTKWLDDLVRLIRQLGRGDHGDVHAVGAQFFITTLEGLPWLLKKIQTTCAKCYKGRSEHPLES
jgi:hypothetical protein